MGRRWVMRYQPGANFGRIAISSWRVQPAMRDLVIEAGAPGAAVAAIAAIDPQRLCRCPAFERRVDIGEILFRGTWNGKKARGYLFVATNRTASQSTGGAMWYAGDLSNQFGFIAAEDQVDTAIEVVKRMQQSYGVNPQWFDAQHNTIEAVRKITEETNRYISNVITQSYASRQATYELDLRSVFKVSARRGRPRRSADAAELSRCRRGSNYYWIDDRGLIVGTNTQFNPDPLWFWEMLTLEPLIGVMPAAQPGCRCGSAPARSETPAHRRCCRTARSACAAPARCRGNSPPPPAAAAPRRSASVSPENWPSAK